MLTEERIREILDNPEMKQGLEKYLFITKRFKECNVAEDMPFQTAYRSFYQMKRFYSDEFAHKYFEIMQAFKEKKHFNIIAPYQGAKDREHKFCEKYTLYKAKFYEYMESEEGKKAVKLFDEKFPETSISDVKKVDFVIWKDR